MHVECAAYTGTLLVAVVDQLSTHGIKLLVGNDPQANSPLLGCPCGRVTRSKSKPKPELLQLSDEWHLNDLGASIKSAPENEPESPRCTLKTTPADLMKLPEKELERINGSVVVVALPMMMRMLMAVHDTWVTPNAYSSPSMVNWASVPYGQDWGRNVLGRFLRANIGGTITGPTGMRSNTV